LITKFNLENIDKSGMYKIYDKWPEISRSSYEFEWGSLKYENIDHIVFAGMGGSGSIGDIFSAILSKTKLHVSVVKGYILPKTVDKNSLVIVTSVSGNTIEALSILNQAKDLDCNLVAFSSGGKIEKFCELKILESILPIDKTEIIESIENLEKVSIQISSNNLTDSNQALKLAQEIIEIPLIYYPWGLQAAAIRFKNSLQENAKMHAIVEDVVEASHNGIVAWEKKSEIFPILLQGQNDNTKTKERWEIFKTYFDDNEINYEEIVSIKGGIISKLIHLMYLLDYVSIYKAVLSEIDPTPVKSIDFIKSRLK
jgi:glucose/mannose-6-phosphate isomerase